MRTYNFEYWANSEGFLIYYKGKLVVERLLRSKQIGKAGSKAKKHHEELAKSEILLLTKGRGSEAIFKKCKAVDDAWKKLKSRKKNKLSDLHW